MLQSVAACEVESPELVLPCPAERSSEDLLCKGESKVGRQLLGPAAYYMALVEDSGVLVDCET